MGFTIERLTNPIAIKGIIAVEATPVAWLMFENIVAMAVGMQSELQV